MMTHYDSFGKRIVDRNGGKISWNLNFEHQGPKGDIIFFILLCSQVFGGHLRSKNGLGTLGHIAAADFQNKKKFKNLKTAVFKFFFQFFLEYY